jgi:hypothetical protein
LESTRRIQAQVFGGFDSRSTACRAAGEIGHRGEAIAAYQDRKAAILRGEKLPATLKNRGIKFSEIGQGAIDWYKRTGKKDLRTFEGRMRILMASPLGGKPANDVDHEMIERWINEHDGWSQQPVTDTRPRSAEPTRWLSRRSCIIRLAW